MFSGHNARECSPGDFKPHLPRGAGLQPHLCGGSCPQVPPLNPPINTFQTTSYVIYQSWFHPLAAYPGPFFAKLTDLYSVVHALRGDRHEDLYQLHQRHGRIVRIGPNRLTILDAEALEPIYGHQANVKKSQWYHSFYSVSIFNAINRNEHARKRRVMSQAFSTEAVRGMEPHILSAIRDWCLALGDEHPSQGIKQKDGWSRPKDMVHWSACLIFDALGEICFGKTFNTSISDENTFFFPLMALSVRIMNICGQMPILRRFGFEKYMRYGTAANRDRQIAFSRKQLATRLAANPTQRRDIVYYLQLARDPDTGKGYSVQELISEVTLLLGAGAELFLQARYTLLLILSLDRSGYCQHCTGGNVVFSRPQ